MKKIAALLVLGLLPLAGCATPYSSGPYAGYASGPYTSYDSDYDQGQDGYGPPVAYYGQPGYGPAPGAGYSYYSQPAYQQTYQQPYAPAYYSAPPAAYSQQPAQGYNYSSYNRCGCSR